MITALCPRCNRSLSVEQHALGRKVACPDCGQKFEVNVQSSGAAAEESMTPWLPGSNLAGEATLPPARRVPPPPHAGGPPPLPPRSARSKLRPLPLAVSAVSVLVILGSFVGIVKQFGSKKAADAPPAAERWAAITIESQGVRLVVIDCVRAAGTAELTLVHATNRDWQLGDLPAGVSDRPAAFDKLEAVLAAYNDTLNQHNVPAAHRLVACNSGVVPEGGPNQAKLKGWAQASVRKALNLDVDVVDGAREAEYGARGSIPLDLPTRMRSVSLDVSSRSTKHGYFDTHKTFNGGTLGTGAKAAEGDIEKLAKARKLAYAAAAKEWKATVADDMVRKLKDATPQLANCDRYYLLGGTPWVVAVASHPQDFARPLDARPVTVTLTPDDIEAARVLFEKSANFKAMEEAILAKVPAGPDRVHLEVELSQVGKAFGPQRALAGASVLTSFSEVCDFKSKQVRFYTRNLHAWPVGYVLVKGKFEQ